ncbi:hypothetical protein GIB67_032448 [Kingdonia uniflora]|uniref:R13L1/DRL21-like LRR repeat region domain-containing protein n=1 Tax=Kingdonia uniflora TaxID=39325 RepID=A0A7J7LSS7_9MAGN|nr:hypothetical protein GIB67_032448 [Kingdonia uniflora]
MSNFVVSEEGDDIGELKHLSNLRGSLRISNIKGVVKEAILKDKEYLRHLTLRFNDDDDDDDEAVKNDDDDEAVKNSCPYLEVSYLPPSLEELKLENDASSLLISLPIQNGPHTNLKSLAIRYSPHLTLPQGLSQLKALQTLYVSNCDSLTCMSNEIGEMKHWEEWVIKTIVNITLMPLLQTLSIWNCPMLKSLPCQILSSSSLREMTIDSCPHLEVSYLPLCLEKLTLQSDAGPLSISLPIQNGLHTNLKSLAIQYSPHSTLPQGLSQLKALQTLYVSNCDSLTCIPDELKHLTSLQVLKICGCPILGPRCKKEVGEDWSIISHIPNIHIDWKKIQ